MTPMMDEETQVHLRDVMNEIRPDKRNECESIKYRVIVSVEVEVELDGTYYQPSAAYDAAVIALTHESHMWINDRTRQQHAQKSDMRVTVKDDQGDKWITAEVMRVVDVAVYPAEVSDVREVRARMRADTYKKTRDEAK
jgi:hypothetical protein